MVLDDVETDCYPDPASMATHYFSQGTVSIPSRRKTILSRMFFPLLTLLSRERSLQLGLVPIDDERVIVAMKEVRGRLLDIGCGANNLVLSYGNGIGVDVVPWSGCDVVIEDAARLPFENGSQGTVTYLASLNHIPNRDRSVQEAYRVLEPNGRILITMITPKLGRFIHWWRRPHDPDHRERQIDHANELPGMSPSTIKQLLLDAGFKNVRRKRFVFGLNNLFTAEKCVDHSSPP